MKGQQVAYQGIEGSYSNEAARKFFGSNNLLIPQENFKDVFTAVTSGACIAGMVPVENSITGSVVQNYDLLYSSNCMICGEYILPVNHVLLGVEGTDIRSIRQVFSHEQGFLQCGDFLATHKNWLRIPYFNTAVAAKFVADEKDKAKAAIASAYAGDMFGLTVLAKDICDKTGNSTRFAAICASGGCEPAASCNKATILFTLRHEQGSLAKALRHLSALNLTRIESRPSPDTNWEYRFYVDLEGDLTDFETVLSGLTAYCTSVRLLGTYQSAR
ncbi:MAG: prephenate dehydratase domain-containing protein [Eubacteriales bacterium]